MPLRTKLFSVLPWTGGVNTSQDPAMISPAQLTTGDNIIMGVDQSKRRREGIDFDWDNATNGSYAIIGLHDFWHGVDGRTQNIIGVDDGANFYSYDSGGTRTALTDAGTAYPTAISSISTLTFNNRLIIAVDGPTNLVKQIDATSGFPVSNHVTDLPGTPPEASVVTEHLGRIFANDKTNVDLLHYSETAAAEIWGGTGDSGAIPIRPGDGDREGITAIAKFKGSLIVFKSTKIYRLTGIHPELFRLEQISDSIGCVGPNAVTDVDGNDLVFVSKRGVHSLVATDQFGDLAQTYISKDIQRTFNDDWTKGRLRYIHARYLPSENTVAFAVSDSHSSSTVNKDIWLYNVINSAWFRWPNLSCPSLSVVDDGDRQRYYIGTDVTRVAKTFTGTLSDIGTDGIKKGIAYEVTTGFIDVENSPFINKAFKNIGLVFKGEGTYAITVKVRIDNFPEQTISISDAVPGDLLGSSFVLGASSLGVDNVMAAHMREVLGCGKYIRLRILMSGDTEQLDLQGFLVEYEEAGDQKEVINANA